jgi:hypothetical protein
MKNSFRGGIILSVLAAVLVLSFIQVSAFGITSNYWRERPLELQPGQTAEVTLELQNMVGNETVTLNATLMSGSEIAQITDASNIYVVPPQTKNVLVHLTITIPEDAPLEKEYTIGVSFLEIKTGGQGVAMGSEIEKSFPVIIRMPVAPVSTPVSTGLSAWLVILIIFIVIIIVLVILMLIKNAKKKA